MTTKEYKNYKGLKTEGLRDHMTNLELALNTLAEATTTEISKVNKPQTLRQNRKVAARGGTIVGNTRKEIEVSIGRRVVSSLNAKEIRELPKE
jgi:hypothetical protein